MFSPNNLDKIDYIRNAEIDGLLGDGHKDWYTFLKENRDTIEINSLITLEKEEKEEENELVYYEKLGKLTKKSEVRSIQNSINNFHCRKHFEIIFSKSLVFK